MQTTKIGKFIKPFRGRARLDWGWMSVQKEEGPLCKSTSKFFFNDAFDYQLNLV